MPDNVEVKKPDGDSHRRNLIKRLIFYPVPVISWSRLLKVFGIVAIISIAAGLLLPPGWSHPAGERARRVRCMNNLKQIEVALQLYSDDWAEEFSPDLQILYNKYISDTELYVCPSSGKKKAQNIVPTNYVTGKSAIIPAKNISYCYVAGLKSSDPKDYILAFDEETNHKGEGMNMLLVGQTVHWWTYVDGFYKQLEKQKNELKSQGRKMKIIRPSEEELKEPDTGISQWVMLSIVIGAGVSVVIIAGIIIAYIRRKRNKEADKSIV